MGDEGSGDPPGPLTVITVHEISVGYWGSGVVYPEDHAVAEHARQAAAAPASG
jgi:hypothetical protein